jgi:hypothetical protein
MVAEHRALDMHLRAEGFRPGAPTAEVAAQDEGVCARSACTRCGSPNLRYRPYVRTADAGPAARYRAFAFCRVCGHVWEF